MTTSIRTQHDDLLDTGLFAAKRRIYFGDYIDAATEDVGTFHQRSVERCTRALHLLASQSPDKPIELWMNSYGGDAYALLRLCDEILACPCPVKFFGGGAVMSAATWVMAVCDERYLYPNTTVMVHDGSDGAWGKHTDVQITAAEMKRLQDRLYDIYTENSRMPREFWERVCQRDLYLTAEETVQLGLADKVLYPKDRTAFRKARNASLKKNLELDELVETLNDRINYSRFSSSSKR